MKRCNAFVLAFALATAGSSAFAKPALMSDAQLDNVAGGQGALIDVTLVDVVDVNNNQVQVFVPVNASVAAGILGEAGSLAVQRPGRVLALQ
jgi:hypothetical protein